MTEEKVLVIATGNSSWWKAIKHRRAAAEILAAERAAGWRLVGAEPEPRRGPETRVFTRYLLRRRS